MICLDSSPPSSWLAGCEPAARKPAFDDLEPYCSEDVLQRRLESPRRSPPVPTKPSIRSAHGMGAEL